MGLLCGLCAAPASAKYGNGSFDFDGVYADWNRPEGAYTLPEGEATPYLWQSYDQSNHDIYIAVDIKHYWDTDGNGRLDGLPEGYGEEWYSRCNWGADCPNDWCDGTGYINTALGKYVAERGPYHTYVTIPITADCTAEGKDFFDTDYVLVYELGVPNNNLPVTRVFTGPFNLTQRGAGYAWVEDESQRRGADVDKGINGFVDFITKAWAFIKEYILFGWLFKLLAA